MSKNKVVIGMVDDEMQAENLVQRLTSQGFASADISAIFPDRHGTRDFAHEHNTKAPEGAVAGVAGGGVLGGTLGLLAGIGALAIPGAGPFIAAGPLMAALSGAAAGAAVGGVAGALVAWEYRKSKPKITKESCAAATSCWLPTSTTASKRSASRRSFTARELTTSPRPAKQRCRAPRSDEIFLPDQLGAERLEAATC